MKKKYLNLLTISCGILLMSVPAGYAAEGDEGGGVLGFDTSGCPGGHYYQSIACHMEGARPSPDAPETNCHCVIEGDEWGHWYCCDAASTGGGGGGGSGGHFNWHIVPGGNNNNGSGCSGLTGTQRQCCEAGFTQHGTTPLYGCPSGKAFMGECPYNSYYWSCLDYADACAVMGYSTSISSCPSGKQKIGCPYNGYLTDKYYKCRDIPCYGKELCGPGTTGCKNGEHACVKNGGIYCSPSNCQYANNNDGSGTCRTTSTNDVGSRPDNNDNGFINCSTDGMRNCDALGYLQNANDCPKNGDRLVCPFDENRFYCGGKIINSVTNGVKPCNLSNVVGGVTTTTAIAISAIQPNNVSDCQSYSNIIPLYNACIRRACAKECYLVKTSEYCVTEYSTALYKLSCDEDRDRENSAECQDDVEADVEGPNNIGSQNSENKSLGEESDQGEMRCNAGELLVDGKCMKCKGKSCDHKKQ